MARVILLLALCVLPAIVSATRSVKNPFLVEGVVYCDPCRAGFETTASYPIEGATVRVQCKDRNTMNCVFEKDATTDKDGKYQLHVDEDHEEQMCDAFLISSSHPDCKSISPGRERARVILTRENGMASENRYANAMGFQKDVPEAHCTQILQQYLELDESD